MNAKAFSVAAVLTVICASCAGIYVTDDGEEPDGFPPLAIALIIAGTTGGFAGGWFVHDYLDSDDSDTQPYMRLAAANNATDMMSVASVFSANANANYAQLWAMTKEHWIRQAELEAYTEWGSGKTYDGNSVLLGSRAYENNAVMTANAVAQLDAFFDDLSEKIGKWDGTDTYDGHMAVGFKLDNTVVSSNHNSVNADLVSVADGSGKEGKVYIGNVGEGYIVTSDSYVPAYVYNFGGTTSIVSENGTSYVLDPGKNYLSSLRSTEGNKVFEPGVYRISNAVIGGDTISAVIGASYIPLRAGLAMQTDGSSKIAILEGETLSYNGGHFESVSFKVEPSDIPAGEEAPSAVELTDVLRSYQTLLDRLYWTSVSANSAAGAVWSIYDRADAKQYGVSTLMASNVYDSVVLSEGMNEVLTLSAMQQMATYFDANGGDLENLKIGLYGNGMDAPFVRGSVLDEYGNTVYGDVIFTPFFQSDSVVLERGIDHSVNQNTLIAVWTEGKDLVAWHDGGMETDGYETAFIEEGYTLKISQIGVCDSEGMHNEPRAEFRVSKVDYIAPGETDMTRDSDPGDGSSNILKVICILAGAVLAVLGIVRRDPIPVMTGIALVVFGVFFAGPVWEIISKAVRL